MSKIVAYHDTFNNLIYCLDCAADILSDETLRDPYQPDEIDQFPALREDDLDNYTDDGLECEYCFAVIYEGA